MKFVIEEKAFISYRRTCCVPQISKIQIFVFHISKEILGNHQLVTTLSYNVSRGNKLITSSHVLQLLYFILMPFVFYYN